MDREINMLIVDDQSRSRQSLRALFATWPAEASIREAANGVEALRLQSRYAWLQGKEEQAMRGWQKSLTEAERLEMRYELGLTHLEIGQRLGKAAPQQQTHLEKAESIFAEIGAELDLARARELLISSSVVSHSFEANMRAK